MLLQLEPARRAGRQIITEREVAVGIRIAPARGDVCRVQDVSIYELDIGTDAVVPFRVSFLDVLAPEVGALEELRALGHFAPIFGNVLLFDELGGFASARAVRTNEWHVIVLAHLVQFLFQTFLNRHTPKLSDIHGLRLQQL